MTQCIGSITTAATSIFRADLTGHFSAELLRLIYSSVS